jgi:hypothetical protein
MGSQRIEFESEAWYRAVAEGRLAPVSDGRNGYAGQSGWPRKADSRGGRLSYLEMPWYGVTDPTLEDRLRM